MEKEGVLEIASASVFDLRDLPSHVKHVRVGVLHARHPNGNRIMWTRDGRLEKVLNIQTLIIEKLDVSSVSPLKWFLHGCLKKLRVLTFSCPLSIRGMDVIGSYRWASLREFNSDLDAGVGWTTGPTFCSENFPRLEKFSHNYSCWINSGGRELLIKTRERKQVATTTFLVMRCFFPAELALMIADEAAFGIGTGTLLPGAPRETSIVTKILKRMNPL